MFAYQAPRLCPQFEDGERRGVVDVERFAVEFGNLVVELHPLVGFELSGLDFLALDFAGVDNQTVHQLHIAHFEREECHGNTLVDGDVLGHGKCEGRFSHGRTCSQNDEVGILPA